jgi:hypothetical protein
MPSEAAAYRLLERLRWDGAAPVCPHCGAVGRARYLRPTDGRVRVTRTGAATDRRVWKCAACRRQFSVLVGTVLQGSRVSLWAWIGAARAGGAVRAEELAVRYGVSAAAARLVVRRLAMAGVTGAGDDALAAVLRLPAATAQRIRLATPARVRPRPMRGPSADYGSG